MTMDLLCTIKAEQPQFSRGIRPLSPLLSSCQVWMIYVKQGASEFSTEENNPNEGLTLGICFPKFSHIILALALPAR